MRRIASLLTALLLTLSIGAFSQTISPAPPLMNFQGRLAKPDGTPVPDGNYNLTFRIFSTLTGGTASWSESFNGQAGPQVAVHNGVFAVLLNFGSGLASGQTLDTLFNGNAYLEIQVNANTPLSPRQQIVSVAYALKANTVPDGSITAAKLGTGANAIAVGGDLTGSLPNPSLATLPGSLAKVSGNTLSSNGTVVALNDHTLNLRSLTDANHIFGYFNTWNNLAINGPVLTGFDGGILGTIRDATMNGALYWNAAGNVGIGTAAPGVTLDVAGNVRGNQMLVNNGIIQKGGAAALSGSTDLGLYSQTGGNWIRFVTNNGNFEWFTDSGTGTNAIMTLQPTGELTANVVTVLGGSDVAEPYRVAPAGKIKPVPGMVVAIDGDHVGQMRVVSKAYDTTVAGILSGANGIRPGLTLTQKGTIADGTMPVASIGRVWCWCDAEVNGPIAAGDMLTTSPTSGHAMKVRNFRKANGAIIGKAMSGLKRGKGLVLVLVSLK